MKKSVDSWAGYSSRRLGLLLLVVLRRKLPADLVVVGEGFWSDEFPIGCEVHTCVWGIWIWAPAGRYIALSWTCTEGGSAGSETPNLKGEGLRGETSLSPVVLIWSFYLKMTWMIKNLQRQTGTLAHFNNTKKVTMSGACGGGIGWLKKN